MYIDNECVNHVFTCFHIIIDCEIKDLLCHVRTPGSNSHTLQPYNSKWNCFSNKNEQIILAVGYLRATNRSAYLRHSEMAKRLPTKKKASEGGVSPKGEGGRGN